MAKKYGAAAIAQAMERSLDYSETLTRARIETIPDGVYEGADFLEPVGTAARSPTISAARSTDFTMLA